MKSKFFLVGLVILALGNVSCKRQQATNSSLESKDSIADSISNNTFQGVTIADTSNIIVKNEGKYPSDIKLFDNKAFTDRVKKITETDYNDIIKYFNVQTPIVSENGIYKFSGCKQHDCSGFHTTIYYDAQSDNINVNVDKNGKITEFNEKGKITITEELSRK